MSANAFDAASQQRMARPEREPREGTMLGGGSAGASMVPGRLQHRLTHLDLFSGIGGFALAAKWAGYETIGFSEIEPHACRVLAKHWPKVKNYGDIRQLTGVRADIITGGFPCQPFSSAGKRKGTADDRHLWPEMCRVIGEARPAWVVGENVVGLTHLALDAVLSDLGGLGYACRVFDIPASGMDARHHRRRLWIVANRDGERSPAGLAGAAGGEEGQSAKPLNSGAPVANDDRGNSGTSGASEVERWAANFTWAGSECDGGNTWPTEPGVGRVADGIPRRVDRLRGLGNAIVPQVAFVLLDAIAALEFTGAVADAGRLAPRGQRERETRSLSGAHGPSSFYS